MQKAGNGPGLLYNSAMPRTPLMLAILAGLAEPALAQHRVEGPTPVDQAVGDLDALSTSQRRIEAGNFHDRSGLWRLPKGTYLPGLGDQPTYVHQEPGVRAFIRRPEYLTWNPDVSGTADGLTLNAGPKVDGAFRPIIPPDTVFDLTHRPNLLRQRPEQDPNWVDRRIDGRVRPMNLEPLNMRVGTRVHDVGNADLGAAGAVNGVVDVGNRLRPWQAEDGEPRELPPEAVFPEREEKSAADRATAPAEAAEPAEAPPAEPESAADTQ